MITEININLEQSLLTLNVATPVQGTDQVSYTSKDNLTLSPADKAAIEAIVAPYLTV